VQIFISAIPFNNLTKNSRIEEENVVIWEDVTSKAPQPSSRGIIGKHYFGLDDYLKNLKECEKDENCFLRECELFEKRCQDEKAGSPVMELALDYMISLCKYYARIPSNINDEERVRRWKISLDE
jgi:hypothetical protein